MSILALCLKAVFWFSLFILLYSYLLYPLVLFLFARFFKHPIKQDDRYFPTVGILVPVHNEADVIQKKIKNIFAIDYPADKLSIWIGSDRSTDATEDIVRAMDDPRIHLWIAPQRAGKTGVINNLAPLIDAEIVLITDANTMHHSDCLRPIVRNFADPTVGMVAGHIDHSVNEAPKADETSGEDIYRVFESRQKIYEGQLHSTISVFGGFYAIRKSIFRPIPANAYNDDVLIPMDCIRQGYRVFYEPAAISEEDFTGSISSEFMRRIRIGAGNFQSFFLLLDFLNPLRGWPAFCYTSHKVTRWFSPLFMIAIFMTSGALSYLDAHIIYKLMFGAGMVLIIMSLLFKVVSFSIAKHAYYFLAMNLALFLGLFKYFGGIKTAAWSRTDRA